MQPNRAIWEGLSLIYLPNGQLFGEPLARGERRGGAECGIRLPTLVPLKLWRYCFEGVAQKGGPAGSANTTSRDEPFEAVSYDLIWESLQRSTTCTTPNAAQSACTSSMEGPLRARLPSAASASR